MVRQRVYIHLKKDAEKFLGRIFFCSSCQENETT